MAESIRETVSAFETLADRYDAWYDTEVGARLFDLEVAAIRPLLDGTEGPRLEVGIGTGRFASALGVDAGVDPAMAPLVYAESRGPRVVKGIGEHLPFVDNAFGAVALVATLCFVERPGEVLTEAARVLRPGGRLIVAFVPLDSPWGRSYEAMGRDGNQFYRDARFYTADELDRLVQDAGFTVIERRSTLRPSPSKNPLAEAVRSDAVMGGPASSPWPPRHGRGLGDCQRHWRRGP